MFWKLALSKNKEALAQIVLGLFGVCGLSATKSGSRPPFDRASVVCRAVVHTQTSRPVASADAATEGVCHDQNTGSAVTLGLKSRQHLARILRAAEAALRRLIVIYVKTNPMPVAPSRTRPMPDFASFKHSTGRRGPVFNLFDPRKPLRLISASPSGMRPPLDDASLVCGAVVHTQASRPFVSTGTATEGEPRIWIMGNSDWSSLRGRAKNCDEQFCQPANACALDSEQDAQSSQRLLTRLFALNHALNTIPKQVRRLARIMARREKAPAGIKCIPPIRPGIPPGHRDTPRHDADRVLVECHGLMRDLEMQPI